jgi:type II secretory pathway predicted ATPase ExeA
MKRPIPQVSPSAPPAPDRVPSAAPFPYRDWLAARGQIESALRSGPFYGLILGGSGAGKTSLAREIFSSLDRHQHQLLYISSPRISLSSIVRFFAQELRVTPKRTTLETIKSIADVLQAQPAQLVAWLDDANSIPVDTLAELRSLTEFSHQVSQILTVVLSGPAELKTLLDAPALFPLKRRISVRCTLDGLRRDELDAFVLHRFGTADAQRLPLGLRDELFERVRGIPALADCVVRHALHRAGDGLVAEDHFREALDVAAL